MIEQYIFEKNKTKNIFVSNVYTIVLYILNKNLSQIKNYMYC